MSRTNPEIHFSSLGSELDYARLLHFERDRERNGLQRCTPVCLLDVISSMEGGVRNFLFFLEAGIGSLRGSADVTDWPQRRAGKGNLAKKTTVMTASGKRVSPLMPR